ncbi:phage virion morphogenesis protein [uncultured Desulfovibrio sp.]|uniref:phage virion morphogenesis protein n=1 Tax=uncultured Desulfovibrio sp. TaxID=167968 RepID=UPI00262FC788|nr:phage virion morphogenesis protein [uncultured Desulfovibrio sp.]
MIRIEVNIDDDQLMDSLSRLIALGRDTTPIMRGLAGIMRSAAEDAFDLERDPVTGAQWAPLNEAYKKQRYAEGYTGRTLNRTGRLRQSLSVRYGRDFALVGVNAPYAAAHQFGALTAPHIIRARFKKALSFYSRNGERVVRKAVRHPGSVIPARPFLGVGEEHKAEMRELIARRLAEAVRGG